MLNDDGQLTPGLYRLTLDDGSVGDYELTGHSQLDHGDFISFQPAAVEGVTLEVALDSRLAASRVMMAVSEDGHVWRIPGNRLAEAEPVERELLDSLAAAYLRQAPFHPPVMSEAVDPKAPRRSRRVSDPVEVVSDAAPSAEPEAEPVPVAQPGHSDQAHAEETLRVDRLEDQPDS